MAVKNYRELIVWQRAMDLVVEVYRVVKLLPKEETYALSDQLRRAVVSIPSNIAEGQARSSTQEFLRFISIAQGSLAEVETQLELAVRVNYISNEAISAAEGLASEIRRMTASLRSKLSTTHCSLTTSQRMTASLRSKLTTTH